MSSGELYCLVNETVIRYKNKTTPDLSIVERLGGSRDAKVRLNPHSRNLSERILFYPPKNASLIVPLFIEG